MGGGIFIGDAVSTTEFIPPHALLGDFHQVLSYLVDDDRIEPQQIVDALASIASVINTLGPPQIIMRNTDLGPLK